MADFYLRTRKNPNDPLQQDIKTTLFFGDGTNDLQVSNADFELIQGSENLNQSMAKILVTERGANQLFVIYGALLQDLIGQKLDIEFLRAKIKQEMIDGLRIYQFINRNNTDLNEQIDTLETVKIEISNNDSSRIEVQFTVITRAGARVGSIIRLGV